MVPLHVHHEEDEVFHVLDGALELFVDGDRFVVEAGRMVVAPRGVPHAYRVSSAEPARWLAHASETFSLVRPRAGALRRGRRPAAAVGAAAHRTRSRR